jgi:uncharacterized membrane protein YhaH (DUF805 family)
MFKNPFSFEGRIRRLEFGLGIILTYVVYFGAAFFFGLMSSEIGAAVLILGYIPLVWFRLAQAAKRCHDLGNSGWYQLIPIYNPFVLLFSEGDRNKNEYGSNPKYPETEDVLESETLDGHLKN